MGLCNSDTIKCTHNFKKQLIYRKNKCKKLQTHYIAYYKNRNYEKETTITSKNDIT